MSSPKSTIAPATRLSGRLRALANEFRLDGGLVALVVASRLLVVMAAVVAEFVLPRVASGPGVDGPILRSLTAWDGFFYIDIAVRGYSDAGNGAYGNVAFPPLYPMLVRLLTLPFPSIAGIVAVVVSNVAFLGALALLVRLGAPYLGRRRATMAAGLLVIYPFASVFAMAYAESLFLLLMLAAFLAAERGHRAWAGILLALTVICRLQGIAIVLPLLLIMLRQDRWRPRPSQAWLLLGPFAALGFLLFVASVTGSVTGFLDAQQAWGRVGLGGAAPGETIAADFSPYQGALVLTLISSVFLLVFVRVDGIRPEYALIPVLFVAAAVTSGSLESVGRITMSAFPFVWLLAGRRSVVARRAWPVVSIGLFTMVAFLQFYGQWVP